jgi:nicotianamine synthase
MSATTITTSTITETDVFCRHHAIHKTNGYNTIISTLIDEICRIHHQLCHIDELKPCDHVNALFTKLVTICTFQYDNETVNAVLNDVHVAALIPELRAMASQGEYYLELTWATDLVQQARLQQGSKPNISRFVYYQNYVDLVKLELHALHGVGAQLNNIVFIGSGPLPLSPILMYQTLAETQGSSVMMHNIDRDQESITISSALLKKLRIDHGFNQHVMDATEYSNFGQADVVILGALVGQDVKEKMEFLTDIGQKMKPGSFIMARSAHSLRKLLYPSIEPYQVNKCGFETAIVLHPFNDVVNSVLIAKKV